MRVSRIGQIAVTLVLCCACRREPPSVEGDYWWYGFRIYEEWGADGYKAAGVMGVVFRE